MYWNARVAVVPMGETVPNGPREAVAVSTPIEQECFRREARHAAYSGPGPGTEARVPGPAAGAS